jgi:lysine 2,3-aminomutase
MRDTSAKPSHGHSPTPPRASRCLLHVTELGAKGKLHSTDASTRFAFRATDYYTALIDWNDPDDPIRRLIVPGPDEALEFGSLDASNEASNTVVPGLQHKYPDTALLLLTDQCAGFCRYCFRKRLFLGRTRETLREWRPAVAYIATHSEITDVLLSGGDPLTVATPILRELIDALLAIPHVRNIRLGSKVPAFNPSRITHDLGLRQMIADVVASGRSFHVMTHFDHPRELTARAAHAVAVLREAGAMCLNQCPVTAGINDDPVVLAELFERCTEVGCPQYYVFQCRPTIGNAPFEMPIQRAFEIVEEARGMVSGLSRRARFCISHESGKIEVVGTDPQRIYARYHRAKDPSDSGRMLVFRRNDEAYWLDQLVPADMMGPAMMGPGIVELDSEREAG